MSKVEEFREAINANEEWQEEVRNFGAELSLFEMELVSGGVENETS